MIVDWERDGTMDSRPCMILAYVDSAFAARWGRFFRRQGWAVHLAPDAMEARRLTHRLAPTAVVIDLDLPDNGGWSAARDISRDCPALQLVLIGDQEPTDDELVGIPRLRRDAEPEAALEELQGRLVAVWQ